VEFLEKCDPEKPVFLFGSFIHPHPPFCPPAPWNKLYRREGTPPFVPENYKEFKPLLTKNFDCDRLGISEIDALKLKNAYYACVSFVDYQMGRIIDTLKRRGMYENTLILLTSDHGEALGDYRNMGKRTMLDTAARVPFIMKVPGQEAGKRADVCSLVDVAPTLLSYAGIDYDPAEYDGVNLFETQHKEVYSQYAGGEKGCYMIATATDKLIWNGTEQKYYYFTDFPEYINRYEEMCESDRVIALREKLAAHMAADVHQDIPAPKRRKINPFGVGRLDHRTRHDEELSRIPAQYKIDLELPDKEPDGF
jgi:arylsulfatase A-like enzyme